MLNIKSFVFNPFMENTYVLSDKATKDCAVVDPGCYEDYEKNELTTYIESENLNVAKLLNTHCHIDHVLGNYFIKQKFNVELYIHEKETPILKAVESYAPSYGFNHYQPNEAEKYLEEGDKIKVGDNTLEVIFVPGHAPGHIAFVDHENKSIIGGDVLFKGSIGRTDLPGGNHGTLLASIHNKLFTLPDNYTVYPGHGSTTTLGEEKRTNPFCAVK